jgi:hypothetical protein
MATPDRPAARVLVSLTKATNLWHIARHASTGYGIHTLCGRSADEGDYDVARLDEYPYPELLAVCRRCQRREAVRDA